MFSASGGRRLRRLAFAACALAAILSFEMSSSAAGGPAASASGPDHPAIAAGAKAPLFSAARLDGGSLSLVSLRGHVVLLDFWAVACPPCRLEMPALETIHRRYRSRGLRVLGVTEMDPTREEARRFIAGVGVTYPIVLDPGARIGGLYALEAHPTTFVIDPRGRVRHVTIGYVRGDEAEIEGAVRAALDAGPEGS